MNNPSREPGLSIRLDATWLSGILRADQIRRDTLLSLATAWGSDEGREDLTLQLDALAEAMQSPRDGELDDLLDAIEGAAAMDDAEVPLDMARLLRLRAELDAVIEVVGRFNSTAAARPALLAKVPGQGRGAAA
ncbi:hypothetical protein [Streptomyces vinaceus]|uniref:hypothetical protein n=1 Tax=Streptomyces vinaceus TaxID=1960 RepID=UPI003684D717